MSIFQKPSDDILSNYSLGTNAPVINTDRIVIAIGKLQAEINAISAGGGGTVLNFSFTDANGFTSLVTNPGTTPNLTLTLSDSRVTSSLLTGFSTGANTSILASDNILQAFEKTQGQLNSLTGSISGTLTAGFIPVASDAHTLADSILQDTGDGLFINNPALYTQALLINSSGGNTGLALNDDGTGATIISTGPAYFVGSPGGVQAIKVNDIGASTLASLNGAISIQLDVQAAANSLGLLIFSGNATNKFGIITFPLIKNGFGIDSGITTPSAIVHLGAGANTAGRGPLKFTSSASVLTTPEVGVVEFTTDNLFFTITTGTARKRLLMAEPVGGLTSGRVPIITTNGRLTDSANLTFATSTLSIGVSGSASGIFTQSGSSSGTITFQTQAAAGTYNMNWPTSAGTSGQVLTSGGGSASPMTWSSPLTASLTSAHLLVGNGSNVATDVAVSGDLTLSNTGAFTFNTVNSDVATFGSATQTGQFTVNGKGLITAATNVTITPAVGTITGLGTGIATFLATPSSANLIAAITDETGSGALVFATSPTLVTPVLGIATVTSINGLTITSSTGTFTLTNAKTLSVSNTLTFTGTDGSSIAFGTGGTVAYTSNNLSVFASTTSAQLAGIISDETGSGSLVFATSPTLVTPLLGVASATSTTITGTGGVGFIELQTQSSSPSSGATSSVRLFSNSTGQLSWLKQTDGFVRSLTSTLTANRVYTLQDSSDTFVMRDTVDTLTNKTIALTGGSNTFSGFTAGSILFSNGTTIQQNNAGISWDNTNNSLILTGSTASISSLVSTVTGSNGLAFDFTINPTNTASIREVGRMHRLTSGTAGAGFTGRLGLYIENAAGTDAVGAAIDWVGTTVTAGSEQTDINFCTRTAGAAINKNFIMDGIGNLKLNNIGGGLYVKEGTNGRMGVTTLVAGTVAISIASVTTSTRAFVQLVISGGTIGNGYKAVCTSGTLTITSITAAGATQVLDTSTLNYILFEPS